MKLTSNGDNLPVVFGIQYTNLIASDVQETLDAMTKWSSYGFSLIPFSSDIVELEDFPIDKIVIPLGGTKLIDLYLEGRIPDNWRLFYDAEKFDQQYYAPIIGEKLLNHHSIYASLDEVREYGTFDKDVFIKPTNDLKTFGGVVVPAGVSLDQMLDQMMHKELDNTEMVIVAPWKNLGREFRVISVYGHIGGISQYKNANNVIEHATVHYDDWIRIGEAWHELDALYRPADVYTIDFVEVDDELKVVEYNCFNASGLYKMNRTLVYDQIVKGIIEHNNLGITW